MMRKLAHPRSVTQSVHLLEDTISLPKGRLVASLPWKEILLLLTLLAALLSWNIMPALASEDQRRPRNIYLPIAYNDSNFRRAPGSGVMLGVYPKNWWDPSPEEVVKDLQSLDAWAGKNTSLAGIFHNLDNPTEGTIVRQFGAIWAAGYTPFANLHSSRSARDIATGRLDSQIRTWARLYLQYTDKGRRTAFLAPLQEMNGDWTPYGGDPGNFIAAFRRIVNIFAEEGVSDSSVIWVFAPNAASPRGMPEFESYYPGEEYAEVVAISAYNFGCHPANRWGSWSTPEEVFGPYIPRLRTMAPGTPIFIAQTGTSAYGCGQGSKNDWLNDAYNYLASEENVRGILYYNANMNFDWAFYIPNGVAYEGYQDAVDSSHFVYIPPNTITASFK